MGAPFCQCLVGSIADPTLFSLSLCQSLPLFLNTQQRRLVISMNNKTFQMVRNFGILFLVLETLGQLIINAIQKLPREGYFWGYSSLTSKPLGILKFSFR